MRKVSSNVVWGDYRYFFIDMYSWLTIFLSILLRLLDRCVSKYLDSQQLVGEVLRKANDAQQQQQQQMMQLQQQMGG